MTRWMMLVPALCLTPLLASAERFVFDAGETTTIRFESKATLESFHGDTHEARGHVILDPENIGDQVEIWVEVDMATLDTGINKRNKDMRENHLHTDEFPTATFSGATIRGEHPTSLVAGEMRAFEIEGSLTLHGVTKPLVTVAEVMLLPDRNVPAVHVRSTFPVDLRDFDIPRPKFLFLKLAEVQTATIDVVATFAPEHDDES